MQKPERDELKALLHDMNRGKIVLPDAALGAAKIEAHFAAFDTLAERYSMANKECVRLRAQLAEVTEERESTIRSLMRGHQQLSDKLAEAERKLTEVCRHPPLPGESEEDRAARIAACDNAAMRGEGEGK